MRRPMAAALWLSLAISLFTAGLVQLGLIRLLLRPVGRLTAQLASFQADPYHTPPPRPTSRTDEIGALQVQSKDVDADLNIDAFCEPFSLLLQGFVDDPFADRQCEFRRFERGKKFVGLQQPPFRMLPA